VEANEIRTALDSTVASLQGGVQRPGIDCAPGDRGLGREAGGSPGTSSSCPCSITWALSGTSSRPATSTRPPSDGYSRISGDQVQRLANSDIQIEVADKLSQLSVLLSSEGDSLSGE
jgi:hypothetical protein